MTAPTCSTVVARVNDICRRFPASKAIASDTVDLTYSELWASAEAIVGLLKRNGIQRGDYVLLCCEDRGLAAVGSLAVFLAGAVLVPVDHSQPEARLHQIIEKASVRVAVSDYALHFDGVQTVSIGAISHGDGLAASALVASAHLHATEPAPALGEVAYVLFTSGTTGMPKGVQITHRGLANLCAWHSRRFSVEPGSRCSSVASTGFDAWLWEVWGCWTSGGVLCSATNAVRSDAQRIIEWFEDAAVDLAFVPTPLAVDMWAQGWTGRPLETLLIGGEALRSPVPRDISARVYDCYGPTECSVVAYAARIDTGASEDDAGPVDGVQLSVVDEAGHEQQPGEIGEIWLSGVGVAVGYLGEPALTAAAFRPSASGDHSGVAFRTGDYAIRRGTRLSFVGRRDGQIKIRGNRVELSEIEWVLGAHPSVAAAAVVPVKDDDGLVVELAAFVVLEAGGSVTAADIRTVVGSLLPSYMVPTRVVEIPSIPRTVNGKTDRVALEGMSRRTVQPMTQTDLAWATAEEPPTVRMIWQTVLRLAEAEDSLDFYDEGGNSLLLGRLLFAIERGYEIRISPEEFMLDPTLAGIEELIAKKRAL